MASFKNPGHSPGTGVQLGGTTPACAPSGTPRLGPSPTSKDTHKEKLSATVVRGAHPVRGIGPSCEDLERFLWPISPWLGGSGMGNALPVSQGSSIPPGVKRTCPKLPLWHSPSACLFLLDFIWFESGMVCRAPAPQFLLPLVPAPQGRGRADENWQPWEWSLAREDLRQDTLL